MTVKELIKKLQKMPQDAEVMYYDGDNGWVTPSVEYILNAPYSYYHKEGRKIGPVVSLTED